MTNHEDNLRFVTFERDQAGHLNLEGNDDALAEMNEHFSGEVFGITHGAKERFKEAADRNGAILAIVVAYDGELPVGYGTLRRAWGDTDGTRGSFSDAYIHPQYRRRRLFLGPVTDRLKVSAANFHLLQVEAIPVGIGYGHHIASLARRGFEKVPGTAKTMRLVL